MCHVLIIEDEPVIAMHIEALLSDAGATSFAFARDEEDAVAAASASPPALITSDVKLVTGTGPAAVRKIVAKLGPVPVIYITASPDDCDPCGGPALILTKPVTRGALARAYHTLTAAPAGPTPAA